MPSAIAESESIAAVTAFGNFLEQLLARAESVKRTSSFEPPLDESHFGNLQQQLGRLLGPDVHSRHFAVIETAVRDTFGNLIATIPIESPAFVKVWNLFDILSILADGEQCNAALLFWLVEELLDSQTLAGCRKVFDYLESRRERITAKHWEAKRLVILRTCNDLLRRLSRTLDPAFCGRVSIFLFQSFPLGDKSSVNLRGEYHIENVTTFDQNIPVPDGSGDNMDVDAETDIHANGVRKANDPRSAAKAGMSDGRKPLDPDALYPIFWSLQESFNQPKKLFEAPHFSAFKNGLEATMATFQSMKHEQASRSKEKLEKHLDETKRTMKRKRDETDDELAGAFNPKYLTSRDLFKLEISDLAFRRNVLVQALIVMEFLLSLSTRSKEKIASIKQPNKAVTYADHQLSGEDTKWVTDMKRSIAEYLKQGAEGPYFYRMVETVLSRDKNWVRWKIEGCPSIELPPISPQTFIEARDSIKRLASNKRLRSAPLDSLSLSFLDDSDKVSASGKFKADERYAVPELSTWQEKIHDDDSLIEDGAGTEQAEAQEAKWSKTWRALRISSRYRLATFDKIDRDDKIDAVFQDEAVVGAVLPEDRRPIVIVDAASENKSPVVNQLIANHPNAFAKVPVHVTRKSAEGEVNGQDYHFIEAQSFDMMRDGDQFLEYSEDGDKTHGTNRRAVEDIRKTGRVPVLEMDRDGAQQVKDNGFDARFIFLQLHTPQVMQDELKQNGLSEEHIQKSLKLAAELTEHSKTSDFYDTVVDNDVKALESVIFASGSAGQAAEPDSATEDRDHVPAGDGAKADAAA
ncbi:THO complex subunit 1 transcription elongation factor-domain-containing protein [Podospora didyma]|uniref:THO complex subunit 1 transcription elongation factor-domain-containing protein n=1 Tax=Podospora didyma TaxID=330526 RepID=A0AAE0N969_9PEZI|nr:THO complex subunit 1 transcription elongation factor-domain-containing protein [Podospora didyma]